MVGAILRYFMIKWHTTTVLLDLFAKVGAEMTSHVLHRKINNTYYLCNICHHCHLEPPNFLLFLILSPLQKWSSRLTSIPLTEKFLSQDNAIFRQRSQRIKSIIENKKALKRTGKAMAYCLFSCLPPRLMIPWLFTEKEIIQFQWYLYCLHKSHLTLILP